jgi:GTP-binding protein Era
VEHRAGFVSLIGKPNVGKSTLMNVLVGERMSIITSKAQTTRHRIRGIVNGKDCQIVFSDTPGVIDPAYGLQEGMMKFVDSSLADADLILYLTEIGIDPNGLEGGVKNRELLQKLQRIETPIFVLVNKIDLGDQDLLEERTKAWKELIPNAQIFPISALHQSFTQELYVQIIQQLPVSPPFFPKDELTDRPLRFFVSEMIREKIFLNYKKEVPYSCEVEVEEYHEHTKPIHIRAIIYVARNSQKGILIGHRGKMLKKVGTEARKDIEAFIGEQIFLELYVKVDDNWRDQQSKLKRYGYLS